jgi:SPASM domain peptide maturase of grasp-with-spasm system
MYKRFRDIGITRGFNRDVLVDFSRDKIRIVPKEVTSFIEQLEQSVDTENLNKEEKSLLNDLIREEIVFELNEDELHLYADLKESWDFPSLISNAIVEIGRSNAILLPKIFGELEALNCFDLSLIVCEGLLLEHYKQLTYLIDHSTILSLELSANYSDDQFFKLFIDYSLSSNKLDNKITVFNCQDPEFKISFKDKIRFVDRPYNKTGCGYIRKENFRANMLLFMESKLHNSCLNRKVTIDKEGNIYNCFNIGKGFGHIGSTGIREVLTIPDFKKNWQIRKDEITVCKDCEFRNICTDCRAFLSEPANAYSKPLKCGYDPYTNKWEDWSLNPLKQKIMDQYTKAQPH